MRHIEGGGSDLKSILIKKFPGLVIYRRFVSCCQFCVVRKRWIPET